MVRLLAQAPISTPPPSLPSAPRQEGNFLQSQGGNSFSGVPTGRYPITRAGSYRTPGEPENVSVATLGHQNNNITQNRNVSSDDALTVTVPMRFKEQVPLGTVLQLSVTDDRNVTRYVNAIVMGHTSDPQHGESGLNNNFYASQAVLNELKIDSNDTNTNRNMLARQVGYIELPRTEAALSDLNPLIQRIAGQPVSNPPRGALRNLPAIPPTQALAASSGNTNGNNASRVIDAARSSLGLHEGVPVMCVRSVRDVFERAGIRLAVASTPLDVNVDPDNRNVTAQTANSLASNEIGQVIYDFSQAAPGDIILFTNTYGTWNTNGSWTDGKQNGTITHVGIVAGRENGQIMVFDHNVATGLRYGPLSTHNGTEAVVIRPYALQ
jgi:hypothetical protein